MAVHPNAPLHLSHPLHLSYTQPVTPTTDTHMTQPPQSGRMLAVTALGVLRDGLINELIHEVSDRGCEIAHSRIVSLGQCLSASFLVTGNWSALGRLETALPGLNDKLGITLLSQRTGEAPPQPTLRPYVVDIVAPQRDDLMVQLLDFFHNRSIHVEECVGMNYQAGYTQAAMCNLHLAINIPASERPQSLREAFLDLCDELSADGILDPIKS